ncbi:nucleotidyltransferase family protein [Ruminococcus sp. CAG:330]|uniref:nucleotidyltransferase family protein n=1 Tax=Ruminococcus sp. CAG:330 TaxID=1262954 RepID=UPI00033DB277|nr:nucleotidyltransferase domain-containing protein [Ruminococcus sp. CAG:330]CDE12543.1 nucleotidyltransferase domain protein [Ruminococcus sp. CAG:330]
MTDTIYTPEQIQQILFPVFLQYPVKKAILFGSYAKGTAETKSDIDILVDSGLKGLAFFGLLEDVVTSLEKEVDLLDVSQITPDSEIDREILKSGVVIYESSCS